MAGEHEFQDMAAHERDYGRFNALMKWGTILSFIFGAIAVLVIAS